MTDKPNHLPERLALLADLNAARYLTDGLLSGKENAQAIALNKVTEPLPHDGESRAELAPVRDLIDDAMYKFRDDRPTNADAWLAPRLHAALRLTRREAADRRIWNYLALGVAPDYVVWRHLVAKSQGDAPKVAAARFRGPAYTQAFSRLWWAAELYRDGPDYGPVVTACGNQEMLNTALRMDVIEHRPTAQAMVRLIGRGTVTSTREAIAMAAAINASAATLMYDVVAPDAERDGKPLRQWIEEAESAPAVPRRDLPTGPYEEKTPERSVDVLVDHFAELFAEAPVRGRTDAEEETGAEV
ncbi:MULTISPECIES: DUF6339 family protein [Streptomyces]|uniref:Uncharacterized protein n=1 Tax=Streptomyces griseus subsp. griseus (strain JCM 4626 / CBS 651.72 / NBRC 13350 / KCC S-0626 / ISP 5235) TaxID=455632 RepID=B1VVZ2_STRGG|nr:DUF6339 family protein [Streptomyces griseus]MBW3707160.1 hypothetical protein [Streptomyces griseus]BAG21503.1 hypothetical protein SGR_4674 [Streptomyces griseus subsp. griseus NBRC 13350]SEE65660.1 hypothetical protein SAMN04490359_4818 [Streptomyces griseus]SQA22888.1 Uncharacterised protein [Streptomyces griseus]